uniref:DUF4283 domain-containing protein n=1 Tax=Gossypium raimondii TaxID=29730 RepID=A0A0D2U170_GOSRA|nr:hypothetical protein B456_013G140300 [Gossypium raimondii]
MSENGEREDLIGDRNTKKVHFKDLDSGVENDMVVDSTPTLEISWRDKVLGRGAPDSGRDEDFEFLDGNVVRTTVNGVSAINFSERIQRILFRNMATTKPSQQIHIMDVENCYFLIKFQSHDDYERVLTQGPWIVLGQYPTVQPWTPEFNPLQAFPSSTMVWVRLPGLSGFLYKRQILEEIRGLIGTVTKLDFQTDKGSRGNFERTVVCIDLIKPLVSQILINRAVQRVQFEALPFVCFPCGRFGHSKATCVEMGYSQNADDGMNTAMESLLEVVKAVEPLERFGPWMIVERKSRRNSRARINTETKIAMNNALNLFGIEKAEIREKEADVSGITFQKGEFLKGINQRSASTDKGNTGLITKTANIFSVLGKADVDGLDFLMEIEGQVDSGLMVEGPGMPIESLVDPKGFGKKQLILMCRSKTLGLAYRVWIY